MTARMRTPARQALVAFVVGGLLTATGIAFFWPVREVAACVVDLQPIQETRQITVMTWPVPDAAAPLQAPRRVIQRRKVPLIPTSPVQQCSPSSVGAVERDDSIQLVPEPGSLALAGIGGAVLFIVRRKARRSC